MRKLQNAAETYEGERIYLALSTHPNLPLLSEETPSEAFNVTGIYDLRSLSDLIAY